MKLKVHLFNARKLFEFFSLKALKAVAVAVAPVVGSKTSFFDNKSCTHFYNEAASDVNKSQDGCSFPG